MQKAPFALDPRLAATSMHWRMVDGWLDLRLADDSRWPWLLLVPALPDIVELDDLSDDHRTALFDHAATAARALRAASGALKTNIATIGNVVAQCHLHVVARSPGDPNWPAPVWGFGEPVAYEPQAARRFLDSLADHWSAPLMPRSFLAADFSAAETSALTGFAGNRLDRWSEARTQATLPAAMADPAARFWGHVKGRIVLAFEDEPRALLTAAELAGFAPQMDRAVLLGFDQDAPRLAVPLAVDIEDPLPDPYKAINLRSLATQGLLPDGELGQAAYGASMLSWHASAVYCGRCGSPTEMREAGAKRHCAQCGRDTFPRTDPVVIMLVVSPDGEHCLLGRSPHFPAGMVSALAGFVEPGETLEMAVRRETFEESGLRVGKVVYHASQPWPFPHTLMIGCIARALETTIVPDETELEECRWFSRTEITDALAKGTPPGTGDLAMPMPLAVAHRLILDWAEGRTTI